MSLNKSSRKNISARFKLVERTYPQIADDLRMDQTFFESQFSNLSAGFKVADIFLEVMEIVNPLVIKSRTHFSKSNSAAKCKLIH